MLSSRLKNGAVKARRKDEKMKTKNEKTVYDAMDVSLTDEPKSWTASGNYRKAKSLQAYVAQLANRETAYRASDYVRKASKRFGREVRLQDVKRAFRALGLVQAGPFIFGKA